MSRIEHMTATELARYMRNRHMPVTIDENGNEPFVTIPRNMTLVSKADHARLAGVSHEPPLTIRQERDRCIQIIRKHLTPLLGEAVIADIEFEINNGDEP